MTNDNDAVTPAAMADTAAGWQPIGTAPKNTPIIVHGYNIVGHTSPDGPYRHYITTLGELHDFGCDDLTKPECCGIVQGVVEHPTHWMPLPDAPVVAKDRLE